MASRYQIKEAVKILKEACNENFDMFKSELHQDLQSLENYIHSSDEAYRLINNDMGKSLAMGFDEKFFETLKIEHNQNVEQFINKWIMRQSDWRYPMVCLLTMFNNLKFSFQSNNNILPTDADCVYFLFYRG